MLFIESIEEDLKYKATNNRTLLAYLSIYCSTRKVSVSFKKVID